MIDLHNLHIGDCVDVTANPLNIKRQDICFLDSGMEVIKEDTALEELAAGLENCMIDEKEEVFTDCFDEDSNGMLSCKFCPAAYKKEGFLRNHLESKHGKLFKIVCPICDKVFPDSSKLVRHKKTCK